MATRQQKEDHKLTVPITGYCDVKLKQLAGKVADEKGIPLSELVTIALANYLGREDLAKIPRKVMGRPRNELAKAK